MSSKHGINDRIVLFLATGFCSGHAPKAPGTVGTAVAFLPYLLMQRLSTWLYVSVVIVCILIGIYLCNRADQLLQSHDNKAIVWDEFCGLWIALFMIPAGWYWLVIGFLLFRLFDILKPFPISWLDKNLKGGVGVMLDDVVAGLLTLLCIQGALIWIH